MHKTQQELAAELGLHQSQVSRYVRRGMPLDSVAAARAWIAGHIRLKARAPLYRRAAASGGVELDAVELLGIAAETLLEAGQPLTAVETQLRGALRRVPGPSRGLVSLSAGVWRALIADALALFEIVPGDDRTPPAAMSAADAHAVGSFWYRVAAGEAISPCPTATT